MIFRSARIKDIETKRPNVNESTALKSDLDLQLMTELWSEPLAVVDPQNVKWNGIIQQQVSFLI